jgi:hypothetical protein
MPEWLALGAPRFPTMVWAFDARGLKGFGEPTTRMALLMASPGQDAMLPRAGFILSSATAWSRLVPLGGPLLRDGSDRLAGDATYRHR